MSDYDGTMTNIQVSYATPFVASLSPTEGETRLHSLSRDSVLMIADLLQDDWFLKEYPVGEHIDIFYNGSVWNVFTDFVFILANKKEKYGILIFVENKNEASKKVFINLIDIDEKRPLRWTVDVFEGIDEDYERMGIICPTPNTKAFVFGNSNASKKLCFYTTIMKRCTDAIEKMCVLTNPYTYESMEYGEYAELKFALASMDGEWSEIIKTKKYNQYLDVHDVYALNRRLFIGERHAYLSVGDVFETIETISSTPQRLIVNNKEYARYVNTALPVPMSIYFKIYGGMNDVK